MMNHKIAILDLGTNTFHMIVTELLHDGYSVIYKEKLSVKIGQGGISKGYITGDAIKRALQTMVHFKAVCERLGVNEIHAIATSAFRNSHNGQDLAYRIEKMTGIHVEIISGEIEAQLIYKGVKRALKIGHETSMILDIGGGSNEFIICNEDRIFWKQSFEIGAQRLLDAFHTTEPMAVTDIHALEQFLFQELLPLKHAIKMYHPTCLIGASGSFDSLAEISRKELNVLKLPGETDYSLPIEQFYNIHSRIIRSTKEERIQIPGMVPLRAEMIVVASILINHVISHYNFQKVRISGYSLKEGILSNILQKVYYNQATLQV